MIPYNSFPIHEDVCLIDTISLLYSRYGSDTGLNFGSWAAYGAPLSLIMVIATWVILGMFFIGPKYKLSTLIYLYPHYVCGLASVTL